MLAEDFRHSLLHRVDSTPIPALHSAREGWRLRGVCQEAHCLMLLPSQVRVLIWNPGARVPGGSHQNCSPTPDTHTPSASPRNLQHACTSALKAGLLTDCRSYGNPIPGCPAHCFSPPAFLYPSPHHLHSQNKNCLTSTKWIPLTLSSLPRSSLSLSFHRVFLNQRKTWLNLWE